jgi:hypothetical protein
VKKLAIVLLLVAAGCRRTVVVGNATTVRDPGAPTPREAVDRFMAAAKTQDLQAMSLVWGTNAGPTIETMAKEERDQREIIMMCSLKHDSYRIMGEAPSTDGDRVIAMEVKFKDLTRSTSFKATRAQSNRWFVLKFDNDALRDICARK